MTTEQDFKPWNVKKIAIAFDATDDDNWIEVAIFDNQHIDIIFRGSRLTQCAMLDLSLDEKTDPTSKDQQSISMTDIPIEVASMLRDFLKHSIPDD